MSDASTGSGTGHWKAQRISALAMSVLGILFLIPFIRALGRDWEGAVLIYKDPFNVTVAVLFFGVMFWHLHQGLEVIIDDYVPNKRLRAAGHLISLAFSVVLGVAGIAAVLIIAAA